MGAINGAGSAEPSEAPQFTSIFFIRIHVG